MAAAGDVRLEECRKGTQLLTIGGLEAYSQPAQENGPRVAKEVWGYEFVNVTDGGVARRLSAARSDDRVVRQIEAQTAALASRSNVKLETGRQFVFNCTCTFAGNCCRKTGRATSAFPGARAMRRSRCLAPRHAWC